MPRRAVYVRVQKDGCCKFDNEDLGFAPSNLTAHCLPPAVSHTTPRPRSVEMSELQASKKKAYRNALLSSLPQVPLPLNPRLALPRREIMPPNLQCVPPAPCRLIPSRQEHTTQQRQFARAVRALQDPLALLALFAQSDVDQ